MLKISELYIYPIKSLKGVKVQHAHISDRGFKHDRRWMLIDDNNRFISQREVAAMALLDMAIEEDGLRISYNGSSTAVPFVFKQIDVVEVSIWDDICPAQLIDLSIDQWFTAALGISCRLVYMPDDSIRPTDARYTADGYITSFADAYPFLLISQASLDDLNSRMEVALPMNRFRPNIVIEGALPYQEDSMNQLVINGVRFWGVKLCARCNVTTINQQTAKAGKEPLKTLARYRLKNNKIYLGQNLIHSGTGSISTGDEVTILSNHAEERFIIPK